MLDTQGLLFSNAKRWFVAPLVFVAAALAACSDPPRTDASTDGATDSMAADVSADAEGTDAAADVPFETAAHPPLPEIPDQGGARLAHPQVVFITFAGDPRAPAIEALGRFIVGSTWLQTVGEEYGVSTGTFVAAVVRPESAPAMVSDADAQTVIANGITDGSIPRPASGDLSQAVYVIFYPSTTTVTTAGPGGTVQHGCVDYFGYHTAAHRSSGLDFAYAVIPACQPSFAGVNVMEQVEYTTSHELIEAATDPDPVRDPGWVFRPTQFDPWVAASSPEVADLCVLEPVVFHEGGHALAPVWSNRIAHEGIEDPCIPIDPPAHPYINVSPEPYDEQFVAPGGSLTITLTGFSSAPVPDWRIATNARGAFMPTMQLDTNMINNGRTATLTIGIPADAPHGVNTIVYVYSQRSMTDYRIWPIVVGTI